VKAIAATRIFDELPPMDDVLARKVTVLGSAGSIGVNTLDVVTHVRKLHGANALPVAALTAGDNVKLLVQQALAVRPELAVIGNEDLFGELKQGLAGSGVEVAAGRDALIQAGARHSDFVMVAIMGAAAIEPALAAIRRGGVVALANKECVVAAGAVFRDAIEGIKAAKAAGFQVCTNTTVYKETDMNEIEELFEYLTQFKVDGHQIAPAYGYSAVNDREIFLTKDDIHEKFKDFDRIATKYNVRQTPIYMEFLRGEREQIARAALVGHEHTHHVIVSGMTLQTGSTHRGQELIGNALHAQLEHAPTRSLERGNRTCCGNAALVEHDDVVARVLDVGQQVRRENQVDLLVMRDIANQLEHLVAPFRIHAVGGLVEEQQAGIVDQRLRQLDALLHTGRVLLDVAIARFTETDVVEHFVRALHGVRGRQAAQLAAVGDKGHGVHPRNVGVVLRHVADASANLQR